MGESRTSFNDDPEGLVDALGTLIRERGAQHFLTSHRVLPSEASLPDHWTPTERGVWRLTSRLMRYAGLAELGVDIRVVSASVAAGPLDGTTGHTMGHRGAAGLFYGIQDGRAVFGVDLRQLSNVDGVVGTMAHEVAHAWRAHHGLVQEDRALEEELTDLTTVYLGFGVLTANAAYLARSSTQGFLGSAWSVSTGGYLGHDALAYLLAVQSVLRADDRATRGRLADALERNQRSVFLSAADALKSASLGDRFQVNVAPSAEAPPDATPLPDDRADDFGEPTPGTTAPPTAEEVEARAWRTRHAGEVRFRVAPPPPSVGSQRAVVGLAVLMAVTGIYSLATQSASVGRVVLSAAVLLTVIGGFVLWVVKSVPVAHCSDSSCGRQLKQPLPVCPGCGAGIAGDIRSDAERFDAEEDLDPKARAVAVQRSIEAAAALGVTVNKAPRTRYRRATRPASDV
ncbi:MAG: hypothetical protein IV100_01700 [Myxococcales bacterium]|nr:hypothetical protein [Myxococcales bacterium]